MEGVEGVGGYAVTVIVGLALAVGVATSGCGSDSEAVTTSDPLTEFAPVVHFAEKERWYPMGAQWFIDRSILKWAVNFECPDVELGAGAETRAARNLPAIRISGMGKEGPPYRFSQTNTECKPYGPKKFLANEFNRPYDRKIGVNDEGFYLDLDNAARTGEWQPNGSGKRLVIDGVPAYAASSKAEVDGEDGLKLSYWLLYGMHKSGEFGARFWEPTHEGDWERFDVLVKRQGDDEYEPVAVRYRWEGRRRESPWGDIEHAGDPATHPVMQAERGTHQMRPAKAASCAGCAEWNTWTALERLDEQDWEGFGGAWGYLAPNANGTGPIGPHGGHGLPEKIN